MDKIKEFKSYDKNQNLDEIYQKSGMRFAFISAPKDGNAQSCSWVKCRDFLHDAFRAFIHKSSCSIYGFSYNYKTDPPIDTRRIRMLIMDVDKNADILKKNILNGVKLINHYESLANIKQRTKRYEVNPGIWVINGPNFWLKSPVLISMYTFLLRLGELNIVFKNTKDLEKQLKKHSSKEGNNDAKYLYTTWNKMSLIVENYDKIFLKGKRYENCITNKTNMLHVNSYHNTMGIVSFCNGSYGYKESYNSFKAIIDKQSPIKKKVINIIEIEKKQNKKQLLRVETPYNKDIYDHYEPFSFYASTVSSPENGRKQCYKFSYCREHMIASIRAALSETTECDNIEFYHRNIGGPLVDLEKTRLLVTVSGVDAGKGKINKAWQELFFAKRVLNTYEKFFGIEESLITTVKLVHKESLNTAWLFTSSKEWITNPVMFSIYIMIIRASKNAASTVGTIDKLSMPKLNKHWKKFFNYVGDQNKDAFIYVNYSKILEVLSYRHELFVKTPVEAYLADNGDSGTFYYKNVGIMSLLDKSHLDTELVKKVEELKIV